ncbi:polyribonucleotide 5'-hydroxyl-kinase Clp1 [Tetranychus urticae]|uniref:Protein CLP1 homolog n=1 Tax=Tetranychus urticae TaxID=32264 RepID=T1L247_TETUR|nr:polyribonucleotide 5'-hydroxyl-kinase Clp1 [Tetranychus urticae]
MEAKGDTVTTNEPSDPNVTQYKLEKETELRFEIDGKEKVQIELISGLAEIFGTELIKGKKYEFFKGTKAAVFTWHGCVVDVTGNCSRIYIDQDTPMKFYANVHGGLEVLRNECKENGKRGPFTLIVGPSDTGKATLARILCNFAIRRDKCPILIDLNVASNRIGIPGTIGVNAMERLADLEDKTSPTAPLIFHFGSLSPEQNVNFYNSLVTRVAEVVEKKVELNKHVRYSGAFINTCNWLAGENGYKSLLHIAAAFEVDVILVLDMKSLCYDLTQELPRSVKIIDTPKSSGVVRRNAAYRDEMREERIRRYFYGSYKSCGPPKFSPYAFNIPFSQLKIYKVSSISTPASCLPIGMSPRDDQTKLVNITPDPSLNRHILSVSFASDSSEGVKSNLMGFVCVTHVDTKRNFVRVLCPQPGPIPSGSILLYSDIQFQDSD